MVCPYCSHKNTATATICNQCGILLHLGRTSRAIPHAPSGAGHGLGFVRGLLPNQRLKARHATLHAQTEELAKKVQERAEGDLKDPARASAARLVLGALFLLHGEIEKSVHWFQQARQMGNAEAEFLNNAAVALARRGTLTQAADLFEQAARHGPDLAAPRANLAHLFTETASDPDPEGAAHALELVRCAISLEPQPTLYNRLALVLCRERRFDEAVPLFVRALKLAGADMEAKADAENDTGLALALNGDTATAQKAFEAALALDPNHAHALANVCLARMGDGIAAAHLDGLARAAHLDPKSGPVRAAHGYGLCRVGAINDGILELKEAVSLSPRLLEAGYNLGKAYADGGALDIAERYLARALQISPSSASVLTALGAIKTAQRMLPQAVGYFEAALKLWPRSALAEANLGIALGMSGDYAGAMRHLKKAGDLDPKDCHIPAQVAWLELMQDNLTVGLDELGIALKTGEHLPEVHNNCGLCYVALGKPELALPHFKRALDLRPDFHAVHYQWGCAHAALQNPEGALREWELSARHELTNADCHVNRGVLLYQKGQIEEAVTEFRHVIILRETRMEDFSNLGLAYARSGMVLRAASRNPQDPRMKQAIDRHKQAIDMFDRSLALDPRNVMLHSNRGLACFFASRPEEAMREWGIVTKLDPAYARRRGTRQQSEFDESNLALVPLSVLARAASLPAKTGPYLPRFLSGYDTEEWDLILSDPDLAHLSKMRRELRHLDRDLAGLH